MGQFVDGPHSMMVWKHCVLWALTIWDTLEFKGICPMMQTEIYSLGINVGMNVNRANKTEQPCKTQGERITGQNWGQTMYNKPGWSPWELHPLSYFRKVIIPKDAFQHFCLGSDPKAARMWVLRVAQHTWYPWPQEMHEMYRDFLELNDYWESVITSRDRKTPENSCSVPGDDTTIDRCKISCCKAPKQDLWLLFKTYRLYFNFDLG